FDLGELGSEQRPVAGDILAVSMKPDGDFVVRHDSTPTDFAAHPYQVRSVDSVPARRANFLVTPSNKAPRNSAWRALGIPRRSYSGTVPTRGRWPERPRGPPPWAAIADTRTREKENDMAAESDPRKYRIEPKIRLTDGRVIGTIADAIALVREHESRPGVD